MAKVGDKIVIKGFAGDEPRAAEYIGKTGTVEMIDGLSQLHGDWGSLAILPEDDFEILQDGETVHTFDMEGMDTPEVYVLPRQLDDLLSQVYDAGNANCDCTVDDHSYMGC
jgi:hypothetical protein